MSDTQDNTSGSFTHWLSVAHSNSAKLAAKHSDEGQQWHNREVTGCDLLQTHQFVSSLVQTILHPCWSVIQGIMQVLGRQWQIVCWFVTMLTCWLLILAEVKTKRLCIFYRLCLIYCLSLQVILVPSDGEKTSCM